MMTDILFTYSTSAHANSYAEIYLRIGQKLKHNGFSIRYLDLKKLSYDYVNSLESSVIADTIDSFRPRFIISDEESLFCELGKVFSNGRSRLVESRLGDFSQLENEFQLESRSPFESRLGNVSVVDDVFQLERTHRGMVRLLMAEIDDHSFAHYWGNTQSSSSRPYSLSVEKKESFIERMRGEDVPIPLTVLRKEVDKEYWCYSFLDAALGSDGRGFMVKEDGKHKSKGVHVVDSVVAFAGVGHKAVVAQEMIYDKGRYPCSLRVVTFQKNILGSCLLYNTEDLVRSNRDGSMSKIFLGDHVTALEHDLLNDLCSGEENYLWKHGILDTTSSGGSVTLTLREDVALLARYVGSLPSRSFLRGLDFVFDSAGNPFLLEAQTGPGGIRSGNFALFCGKEPGSIEYNISSAVEFLACEFQQLLDDGKKK